MDKDEYMAKWHPGALVDFMERGLYYSPDGQPIPRDQWVALYMAPRTVALTSSPRGKVSTIYMGLDLGFGYGPPLIYESMVFGGDLDGLMDRYPTRAAALAGHEAIVRQVKGRTYGRRVIHNGRKPRL